jgi:hypothetical protein
MSKDPNDKKDGAAPASSVPTDAEIDAATERLGADWLRSPARPHAGGSSQIVQNLARGRAHAVTVEIKRPPRQHANPRRR